MGAPKNKKKKCIILVNLAGLYLFRPASGHSVKLTSFISVYDIEEITFTNQKQRDIKSFGSTEFFVCDHADEAVLWLASSRSTLFTDLTDPTPIKFTGFPSTFQVQKLEPRVQASVAQLRYVSLCVRSSDEPSEGFIELLKTIENNKARSLFFDESLTIPSSLKTVMFAVKPLGDFLSASFRGLAPYGICRLAHHLLKKCPTFHKLTFERYSVLIPSQLRLATVKDDKRPPLSVRLLRCTFSESVFVELLERLSEYKGEFQRLAICGAVLSARAWKAIFTAIKHSKAFRTLEALELDEVDCSTFGIKNTKKRLQSIFKHARSLQLLSLSNWATAFPFQSRIFERLSALTELTFTKANLLSLPQQASLPPRVRLVSFSRCSFSAASLARVLEMVALLRHPFSLSLADLAVTQEQWALFYAQLDGCGRLAQLAQLDWSGNDLAGDHARAWAQFFVAGGALRFVALDRVFTHHAAAALGALLQQLPPALWGLSLGGDTKVNFAGHARALCDALAPLTQLAVLHLNGQHLTESDAEALLEFVAARAGAIAELAIDDTVIPVGARFFELYGQLAQRGIACVGRPVVDLRRGAARGIPVARPNDEFRALMAARPPASSPRLRAHFIARAGGEFGAQQYARFCAAFPTFANDDDLAGIYGIEFIPPEPTASLLALGEAARGLRIHAMHRAAYAPALDVPPYPPGEVTAGAGTGGAGAESAGAAAAGGRKPVGVSFEAAPAPEVVGQASARARRSSLGRLAAPARIVEPELVVPPLTLIPVPPADSKDRFTFALFKNAVNEIASRRPAKAAPFDVSVLLVPAEKQGFGVPPVEEMEATEEEEAEEGAEKVEIQPVNVFARPKYTASRSCTIVNVPKLPGAPTLGLIGREVPPQSNG